MRPTITVNYTDLINDILKIEGLEPLIIERNEKRYIKAKSIANARSVIQSALATYYNIKINNTMEVVEGIDELDQYKRLRVTMNYDLERLDK